MLVLGGARSGKSSYAESRAERLAERKAYIATAPVIDEEMAKRIERHRRQRSGNGWQTFEEPLNLAEALDRAADYPVVLVDCLTLWINNLLYRAEQRGWTFTEEALHAETDAVLAATNRIDGTVLLVSNEVGMGLVPADASSRRYRDLIGRCNQRIASRADEVVFLAAGLPLQLKPKESR